MPEPELPLRLQPVLDIVTVVTPSRLVEVKRLAGHVSVSPLF